MKIYRLTQEQLTFEPQEFNTALDFDMYDYFELVQYHIADIVGSFKYGEKLTWNPVPINRLKPVYTHFVTRNYLDHRDIKAIHAVLKDVISNVARLNASTQLCGHDVHTLEDLFNEAGEYTLKDETEEEKFYDFMEIDGKSPISDYGLPQLHKIIEQIPAQANNPTQLLVLLDQMLNVVHQRNDLASFLIQGGTETLLELSSML